LAKNQLFKSNSLTVWFWEEERRVDGSLK
jgi:hypothetical protein